MPVDAKRFGYQPALDGLRAVALLGVVGYHAGIDWLRGGFLGVSTFFTLSGFLITTLLLQERSTTGTIALGSFWERRIRRLLPAAMVTIIATTLVVAWIGDSSQLDRLRTDALASLFHFSNWRFISAGDSYGALFQSPSFFRHFWSLAVEEQYYFVVPALLTLTLRRGATRAFAAALTATAVALLAWPALLITMGASTDRVYFGTDGRLGELALGAVLAVWWQRRADAPASLAATRALDVAALGAIAATAAMWATAEPTDLWLYRGGLAIHAALALVILVAAMTPGSVVRRTLAFEPLRRLGVISYGGYLLHWPVLLVLQQETALEPLARVGVGLAITIPLAAAMHRWIETPIRRARGSGRRLLLVAPATAMAALMIVAVAARSQPTDTPTDFAQAQRELEALTAAPPPPAVAAVAPNTASPDTASPETVVAGAIEEAPGPAMIAMFGDSTALMTGLGIAEWAAEHPDELWMIRGAAKLGCGLIEDGTRILEGREVPVGDDCVAWLDSWLAALDRHQPTDPDGTRHELDLAIIQLGAWEIVDHRTDGGFTSLLDDARADQQRRILAAAVEALHERAATVVLIAHPDVGAGRLRAVPAGAHYAEYDVERSERWREIVAEVAAERPDTVVIDLNAWIAAQDDDLRLRPDGVHFSTDSAREVADWLAPELLDLVDAPTPGT
ncbi:MAG: acyltransferase family protein [Acidimicrobiales bacterium]|nr:acyltransferase family protein [Acidimicrobiales bacterium]